MRERRVSVDIEVHENFLGKWVKEFGADRSRRFPDTVG